ncbi:MAG: NnrS family protein, partial [Alphaproteobacteria bacterium]|nr:NnrS family protein [Alphaproteobacteria bacterium]
GLAVVAAVLLMLRMRYWRALKTLGEPILWILHLGHAWLAVAFACSAVAGLTGLFPQGAALHAFTSGAIGTTVIGMMTRVALGHTGRALKASPLTVVAYLLVTGAALLRVAAAAMFPLHAEIWILASGGLWSLAFSLYVVIYWPVLTGPRIEQSTP